MRFVAGGVIASGYRFIFRDPIHGFLNVNPGDLEGDATVWDDLRVPLNTGKVAGGNVPTFEQIGSSGVYAYNFDDDDEMWFATQMPHSYKLESDIYPHMHWSPETDVSPADNVGLGLECSWSNIGSLINGTAVYTREASTGINAQYDHLIHNVPADGWDGTGKDGVSSLILCRA
ncbi:unnamed protein product, partial [marine sediment metagenome]